MLTVTLEPDVAEEIDARARDAHVTLGVYVDAALRAYLAQLRHDQIAAEQRAFEQQKPDLLSKYPGEYVAIHAGQVIDHDLAVGELHQRVFARLGRTPVLLKRVTNEPDRVLMFRSPRLTPISS